MARDPETVDKPVRAMFLAALAGSPPGGNAKRYEVVSLRQGGVEEAYWTMSIRRVLNGHGTWIDATMMTLGAGLLLRPPPRAGSAKAPRR